MFDNRQAFPVALARFIFCQVLLALHYCHHVYEGQWTLIHRDLKPENGECLRRIQIQDYVNVHYGLGENGTVG